MVGRRKSVFLYYPNIVGYLRIILAFVSFYLMSSDPWAASLCYFTSGMLDAVDGYLARTFNQASRFGAMVDQLTDRCTFMALLMALCKFYPSLTIFFQSVAIIDISSHWMHLHAADLTGKTTHKSSENLILNYYYTSRQFLFLMCFGNEAFYGLLYIAAFWSGPTILGIPAISIIAIIFVPFAVVKSLISLVHLVNASQCVANYDMRIITR